MVRLYFGGYFLAWEVLKGVQSNLFVKCICFVLPGLVE